MGPEHGRSLKDPIHSYAGGADAPTRGRVIHWAQFYDQLVSILTLGRAGAMRDRAATLAQMRPGDAVLEVGCGTGELALRARRRVGAGGYVCGIDASAGMIAVARRKSVRANLTVDYRVAAVEALPFADASFDVVLSSLMMHHLPPDLKVGGLAEIRRVLKPGGLLLIVDLKRPSGRLAHLAFAAMLHGNMRHGVQDLPPLLTTAGFGEVRTTDATLGLLGFVLARVDFADY